ncbi:hypothetical protein RB653_006553 [Dictyostelium firmibasis]|uniref:Uncharacterized protein n=1 Tax=Dictyostelium firmibasis TaxID=79012 RepID=A0AAN7YWA9_9MYCE
MPKIKTSRKKYPKGWDIISSTLDEFDLKMREAEANPHEGKRKSESNWPIFRIHHQRTRYVYEKFYKNKEISREVYEFCLSEGYADKNLIAKWKKLGYERLCCLKCIQDLSHVCICRVPPKDLDKGTVLECVSCGCKGCATGSGSNRNNNDGDSVVVGDNNNNNKNSEIDADQKNQTNENNNETESENES